MNVRLSILGLISWATIAACGARAAGPSSAPPLSPKVFDARMMEWKRETAPMVLPAVTRRVQLVITPAWTKGEHLVWLISNGTDVVKVFRCTSSQRGEVIEAVIRTIFPTSETPLDRFSFGILGTINKPPPTPPWPGGDPEWQVSKVSRVYVRDVLDAAWSLNHEGAKLDGQTVGP